MARANATPKVAGQSSRALGALRAAHLAAAGVTAIKPESVRRAPFVITFAEVGLPLGR
jgi:hypothetical protein